jgi:hypothetical protein
VKSSDGGGAHGIVKQDNELWITSSLRQARRR